MLKLNFRNIAQCTRSSNLLLMSLVFIVHFAILIHFWINGNYYINSVREDTPWSIQSTIYTFLVQCLHELNLKMFMVQLFMLIYFSLPSKDDLMVYLQCLPHWLTSISRFLEWFSTYAGEFRKVYISSSEAFSMKFT